MDRRRVLSDAIASLPAGADHVTYPDHPLLFRGPDLLAGVPGNHLTALFLSSRGQAHTAPSQLSRYLLTKLALPDDAVFVLYADETMDVGEEYGVLFNDVEWIRRSATPRLPVRAREPAVRRDDDILGLREPHHQRFAAAWDSTLAREPRGLRATDRPTTGDAVARSRALREIDTVHLPELSAVEPPRPEAVASRDATAGAAPRSGGTRPSPGRELARETLAATRTDYALDYGLWALPDVSALLDQGDARLPIRENTRAAVPSGRGFDPDKPLRAAAFAGIETLSREDTA